MQQAGVPLGGARQDARGVVCNCPTVGDDFVLRKEGEGPRPHLCSSYAYAHDFTDVYTHVHPHLYLCLQHRRSGCRRSRRMHSNCTTSDSCRASTRMACESTRRTTTLSFPGRQQPNRLFLVIGIFRFVCFVPWPHSGARVVTSEPMTTTTDENGDDGDSNVTVMATTTGE